MKKTTVLGVSLFFSFFLIITSTFSQVQGTVVGKLFTKDQANQLFGPVLSSHTISSAALLALAQKVPDFLMFNIINGHLYILNSNRSVLHGPAASVSPTQVFHYCSASKILELIQTSGATSLSIEVRQNNMTITANSYTLEDMMICPPTCAH